MESFTALLDRSPSAMVVTTGAYSEFSVARAQTWAAGSILVMDRGFVLIPGSASSTTVAFPLTRMKKKIAHEVLERRTAPGVVTDEIIRLPSKTCQKVYPQYLRLVTVANAEGEHRSGSPDRRVFHAQEGSISVPVGVQVGKSETCKPWRLSSLAHAWRRRRRCIDHCGCGGED